MRLLELSPDRFGRIVVMDVLVIVCTRRALYLRKSRALNSTKMDGFLKRRQSDVRFSNELRRVDMSATNWYNAGTRINVIHETFAVKKESNESEEPAKKKKKKRTKKTESGNEKSATSDGSDSGICWSDYERTPNTVAGTKGSCRPK